MGVDVFHISRVTINSVQKPILVCSLGTTTYTKDVDVSIHVSKHVVFDENTLSYVSSKQSKTNIDVSSHLATFVESFSKLQAHDNMIQGKYRLLPHTLITKMLLHLMYSLMLRVLLTSNA